VIGVLCIVSCSLMVVREESKEESLLTFNS
jgi:hypothetical protein